jgi:hypothetical protein
VYYGVNVKDLLDNEKKQKRQFQPWKPTPKALRRPIIVVGRNEPVRDLKDALGELREPRRSVAGIRARVFINEQKELQILGCGQRVVTIQLRGNKVLLHHNGNTATMKRLAFKEFLARNKKVRREKPYLRPQRPQSTPVYSRPITSRPVLAYSRPDYTTVLQGDDYQLTYDADGHVEIPACLDRRKPKLLEAAE